MAKGKMTPIAVQSRKRTTLNNAAEKMMFGTTQSAMDSALRNPKNSKFLSKTGKGSK